MMLLPEEQCEEEGERANQYVLNINVAVAEIGTAIFNIKSIEDKPASPPETAAPSGSNSSRRGPSVKLPKVNIETFSGELATYPAFMDSYESIIHNNATLSNVEKFYYLKGLLRGKASTTIEGLSMTSANYESALELLKNRFGDRKSLQAHFIDLLMNLKPVDNAKDVKALRTLHDKIESIVRNLKTLGIDDDTYGPLIMPCILQKLPSDISLEITKSAAVQDSDEWDFQQVISEFEKELKAREKCQLVSKPTSASSRQHPSSRSSTSRRAADSSFHAQAQQPACIFCKGAHPTWKCDVMTDTASRRRVAQQEQRCFNCLRQNHQLRDCKSKFACQNCSQRHHTSICDKANPKPGDTALISEPVLETTIAAASTTTRETALLKTAIVEARNPNTSDHVRGRLLFDYGITSELCE